MKKPFVAASLVGALYLSAATAQPDAPHDAAQAHQQCVSVAQWVLGNGETISNTAIMKRLAGFSAVLLGEDHDSAEHHRWQLATITELYALQPDMALGFEAFPRRVQPILNQWVAGELNEKEFLEAVDWPSIWSYDPQLYMPMFHFARMHRIPMYALNVERELVSMVGEKGWENVPHEMREGVTDPAPPSDDYLELLAAIFGRHASGHGQPPGETVEQDMQDPIFRRFVQGQLVWDRAMAEVVHDSLAQSDIRLFVGVAGAGHIIGGYGIPHQLKALGTEKIASLLPWDGNLDCDQLQPDLAYAVFGMNPPVEAETAKPRLGVFLEETENGPKVAKVTENSVAETSGIQPDDVVVEIAGRPATSVSDVVKAVQDTAFGTWLPITVKRENETIQLVAKFPPKED